MLAVGLCADLGAVEVDILVKSLFKLLQRGVWFHCCMGDELLQRRLLEIVVAGCEPGGSHEHRRDI